MIFLEKLKESSISVLPIMALVSLLHFALAPLGVLFVPFLLGGILIIAGLSFFLVGADIGVLPMGQRAGSALVHKRSLPLLLGAGFVIGFIITVAEPDVQVLAVQVTEVAPSISGRMLVLMIAAGVGFFVSVALLRVTFQVSLRRLLALFYALLFLCAAFSSPEFLGVGFDAGGATTGPMTVPFILALGMGVAAVRGGNAENDSFGFIGLASIGPIMAVLFMGMLSHGGSALPAEHAGTGHAAASVAAIFLGLVPEVLHEVLVALGPLFLLFAVFQITLVRMPSHQLMRLIMGLVYTFIGLALFFLGVKGGFMPAGRELGALIASGQHSVLFVAAGVVFGALVVCAEPRRMGIDRAGGGNFRRQYPAQSDDGGSVRRCGLRRGHGHVPYRERRLPVVFPYPRLSAVLRAHALLPAALYRHSLRLGRSGFRPHGVHLCAGVCAGRVRRAGRQPHYRRLRRHRAHCHDADYCHPGSRHSGHPRRKQEDIIPGKCSPRRNAGVSLRKQPV